ncbi:MAG: ATP-binding protein [Bradyrhizobium sp.]|uniref:AAA family ATPase n=1 Tax=Bradyrhizobium sp. TaxID=376 RepID=UPI001E1A9F3B|nr:AAA family ATPase [Bradyrhizobium sp.]MBV9562392.1 ATP-binding protein [Bradyrhizobium sp.]
MSLHRPALIVFGGLPGTGKTTISRELTRRIGAVHLRIDSIEQSLAALGVAVDVHGYAIANALAAENLRLGQVVIADCVNPVVASRNGWRETAARSLARLIEIEVVCSDRAAHRRRVETRRSDIEGLDLPTWEEIVARFYEPWDRERLVLDTANVSADRLVDDAEAYARDKLR